MPKHVHHWMLGDPQPDGQVKGRYQKCRRTAFFPAWPPTVFDEWLERKSPRVDGRLREAERLAQGG